EPRFIHTVSNSAVDQIADACAPHGGGHDVVVLSPFHDKDGSAVRRLAEKTGSAKIAVGLSPDEDNASPFPFFKAKSWNKQVRAVRADLPDDERPLHAKWIEVELADVMLTLTGSINSTSQSLCTTNNIEVGVLRIESKSKRHVHWKNTSIPHGFNERPIKTPGLGQGCLVHAAILGDGTLTGQLLSTFDPSGVWTGKLTLANGDFVEFAVTVNAMGKFRTPLPQSEKFAFASALQIELTRGDRSARGWVQLDEILRMPRLHRIGITSLLRMLNREETEEDDVALLEYFAMSSSKHAALFDRQITITKPEADLKHDTQEIEVIVGIDEIAPDPDGQSSNAVSSDLLTGAEDAVLERVFAQLRRRLLGPSGSRDGARSHGADTPDNGEDDSNESNPSPGNAETAFERFDEEMYVLAIGADNELVRRTALVIWFEVSMHMLLRRLKDRARAIEFARNWFQLACSEKGLSDTAHSLEQHVFTLAALVPLFAAPDTNHEAMRTRLHESLEHFCGGDVNKGRALSALDSGRHVGFTSLLLDEHTADLQTKLIEILQTRTRRHELQEAIDNFQAGLPPDPTSPLFAKDQPYASQLRTFLSQPSHRNVKPQIREQRTIEAVCAHCFVEFNTRAAQDLDTHRIAQCASCRRLTVRLKP
ncbi:MAG TPA: hypothetical protein PK156_50390, partial [Polyangium sp.]|nr:hypothetical protein [Polyangium sp.]